MHLKIEQAVWEDREPIIRLSESTFWEHHELVPTAFPIECFPSVQATIEDQFLLDWRNRRKLSETILVAKSNSEFVGFVMFKTGRTNTFNGCTYIIDIAVEPPFRRNRIAHTLLSFISDKAKSQRLDAVIADVWSGNHASENLFINAGFTVTEELQETASEDPTRKIFTKEIF
jgi:ribosomal protein S18 acetylase RimI-like enzyme